MKRIMLFLLVAVVALGLASNVFAYSITGGDALDQASADDVLDIVFAFDTSGSMSDEISAVRNSIDSIIANLDCPDCDVWVRANLMGITSNSQFGENVRNYVTTRGGTPLSNQNEDNGPAVTDLVNWYNWNDDTTATQDYYQAIVTIGDEGTENGHPPDQADWDASYLANQTAIANDIMVFSVVGTPYPSYVGSQPTRDAIFQAMAIGGSGGGYLFGDTGGAFVSTTTNTIEIDLEDIICAAGSGGPDPNMDPIPEPTTFILLGAGLIGLVAFRGKFKKN